MKVHWRHVPSARNSYAALYAACEKEGFVLEPVDRPKADVTCYSFNSLSAAQLLPEMANAPGFTIAGGPHATACQEEVLRYADFVVVGEGEAVLPALLSCLADERPVSIPGVASAVGYTPADSTVFLDAWPCFSRMKGYVEISRGCPFSCAYCQTPRIFGQGMRHRSIDRIVEFASRYRDARFVSPNAFAYGSDGRNPRLDKVKALLSALRNRIWFGTFPGEVRPEFVTAEALDLVTTYCANECIQFGAQSGSDEVLRRLGRGHSVEDVIRAVELTGATGLTPIVDIIVGLPFETDDDQRATADLARWIAGRGRLHAHYFLPLPGTPLAQMRPRPLIPDLSRLLGSLALRGKLTGSWRSPRDTIFSSHDRLNKA
jgi:B12-binding domain/radical SAM domain protein